MNTGESYSIVIKIIIMSVRVMPEENKDHSVSAIEVVDL